jgi:hypothetical protein
MIRRCRTGRFAMSLVAALAVSRCTSGPPPPADDRPYEERVLAARAQKDADFRAAANQYSPIPLDRRASFAGLPYYPVQPEFRVPAALTEIASNPPVVIALPNSAHEIEQKVKVGRRPRSRASCSSVSVRGDQRNVQRCGFRSVI